MENMDQVNEMAQQMRMFKSIGTIGLILGIFSIVVGWKIYAKAGKPGWAVLVPIYNIIVMLEIVKKPIWWIALIFIPFMNMVILILINIALAEKFGKSAGFGLGLAFLGIIFAPILAFGSAQYEGSAVQGA